MKKKIVVVGSLIADIAAYTPRFPVTGETALGTTVRFGPGGKGNNQATAAARAGGEVTMISKMGNDFLRALLDKHYETEGMTREFITISETAETGSALIEVLEDSADNRIIVVKGANDEISAADVQAAEGKFAECDVFLTQLETSLVSVQEGKRLAMKYGKTLVLNPAPFQTVPDGMFEGFDYVTPNETEAEFFTGVAVRTREDMEKAGRKLIDMGAKNAIITLGVQGSFWTDGKSSLLVPALKVNAVDTTGAGDAYNGGLSVALAEGMDIEKAIQFASATAGISVTGRGSAPSMPRREAINELMYTGYGVKM